MRRGPLLSLSVAVAALTIAPAREPDAVWHDEASARRLAAERDRLVLTFVTLGRPADRC